MNDFIESSQNNPDSDLMSLKDDLNKCKKVCLFKSSFENNSWNSLINVL